MYILGLDVGTTACKCIVFSEDGTSVASANKEYFAGSNVNEINGDNIWINVCEIIKECTSKVNGIISALAVSSFGEAFVPIDKNGNVLADTMLYTDPRGAEQCENFVNKFGEDNIMQITGIKPHPMYSLPKIGYIYDNKKDVFENTYKYLLIEDFVIFRLTGEAYIDYSLASRTMAFNVITKTWDSSLLALANITEDKLSKPVPSGTAVGPVKSDIAELLGLSADTVVVTGGHDQVCAAIGAGIITAGHAIDGTGTVECITPAFDKPVLTPIFLNNNFACVPHAVKDMYVTYAFNFTGGSILKWYRNNLAKYEKELALKTGINVYKMLDDAGYKKPTDIMVIPHFAGSGTPDMNTSTKGAIIGLQFNTDASMIYRALIEGVTYEMAYNMEILNKAGIQINELRTVGGGAKSLYWLKIKAAITGCSITSLNVDEAGIVGTAMLAGTAVGIYKNISEAASLYVKAKLTLEPDTEDRKVYKEKYELYKKARKLVCELYK